MVSNGRITTFLLFGCVRRVMRVPLFSYKVKKSLIIKVQF